MKTLLTNSGIVSDGKLIPWSLIFDGLNQCIDKNLKDKLEHKIKDRVEFQRINWDNLSLDVLKEMALIIKIKAEGRTENQLRSAIKKKLKNYETSLAETQN